MRQHAHAARQRPRQRAAPRAHRAELAAGGHQAPPPPPGQSCRRERGRAAAIAIAIPAAIGHTPGPVTGHRAAASTVYFAYVPDAVEPGKLTIIPISTATNTAGKPIRLPAWPGAVALTPDGKTLYAAGRTTRSPRSAPPPARPGKPIRLGGSPRSPFASRSPRTGRPPTSPASRARSSRSAPPPTPPASRSTSRSRRLPRSDRDHPGRQDRLRPPPVPKGPSTVIPINTATNTAGKPIRVGPGGQGRIAITPDGKTAYVAGSGTVTPISTATNTAGKPIRLGGSPHPGGIAITPDGKTAYVGAEAGLTGTVVPISTATNTPGKPIRIGVPAKELAFTPDGKTLTPPTPTGRPAWSSRSAPPPTPLGKPIRIGAGVTIAITPDGKTLYAATVNKVIPISTATNTPGKPIRIPIHGAHSFPVITP